MQMNSFSQLPWDTAFFGYKVARVVLQNEDRYSLEQTLHQISRERIRLTYFFVSPTAASLNRMVKDVGGLLVDEKVTFSKIPVKHSRIQSDITEYKGNGDEMELVDLALQAGLYSRFRLDDNFRNAEFEKLYKSWLENSLNGEIAFKVLVAILHNKTSGLLTLGAKGDYADIGLLSVDKECRGMGIGTGLIDYADNIAYNRQYKKIKVVTQLQNEGACLLYKKCGFEVESTTNVYHLWHQQ